MAEGDRSHAIIRSDVAGGFNSRMIPTKFSPCSAVKRSPQQPVRSPATDPAFSTSPHRDSEDEIEEETEASPRGPDEDAQPIPSTRNQMLDGEQEVITMTPTPDQWGGQLALRVLDPANDYARNKCPRLKKTTFQAKVARRRGS